MYPELKDPEPAALEYDELVARLMGNVELAERLIASFQRHFQEEVTQIQKQLDAEDADGIAVLAHRLKGASANVAAERLRHLAEEIEQLARAEQLDRIPPHLDQLRDEWTRFVDSASSRTRPPAAAR
jgi:HPt (histidine-containing phosphotransfer) domain-containing protein